jgi:tetratricopeptide (TPR) repeat protein
MSDQPAASRIAREAFELWEAGRLNEAAVRYAEALRLADPEHYGLADYHGEFACVLAALGRHDEERQHLELAVAVQSRQDDDDAEVGISVARYFLADHLVKHNDPTRALEVVRPSLAAGGKAEWILRVVEAEALVALGRASEASGAAARAIELAPSDAKRAELRERFTSWLDNDQAG